MTAREPAGEVLLLCDDRPHSESLARWIAATGHDVVTLFGGEKFLMNEGDDPRVNLVVTDLDSDDPAARALLERLLAGDLFGAVPQLHLFRDLTLMEAWRRKNPSLAPFTIPSPPQPEDFQARVRLAAELGRLKREAAQFGARDALTGLPDRRRLLTRLDEEFSRARRYRTPLTLALIAIDRLKEISEHHGASACDAVVQRVGALIGREVRREDILGRMGNDLFGVVLPGNRFRGAAILANKVRTEAEASVTTHSGVEIAMRLSCGISTYPDNQSIGRSDDLLMTAEAALGEAKARGGNRVFIDEGVLISDRPVVLVVDADTELLELVEDLLALDDFTVVKTASARSALQTLSSLHPDLLVLDLAMLDPEDDVALIERVVGRFPGTRFPIIGLLRDPAADPDRLARLGVDRFITKPFSISLLRGAARELLDAYRS